MVISFLFTTDIHGDLSRIDSVLDAGKAMEDPPIILGGDLYRAGKKNDMDSQIRLLKEEIEPRVKGYGGEVYTIFGNNDWKAVSDRLEDHAPSLISLQGRDSTLEDGTRLKGLSFVPPSPFLIKDWEKMEKYGDNEGRGRLQGLCSKGSGLEECSIEGKGTMWDEIMKLGGLRGTILVSHGPPFGTCADVSRFGPHLGSLDLTRAVLKDPPLAILCGHIHESPELSGRSVCKLGETFVANPGSRYGALSFIVGRNDDNLQLEHRFQRSRKTP